MIRAFLAIAILLATTGFAFGQAAPVPLLAEPLLPPRPPAPVPPDPLLDRSPVLAQLPGLTDERFRISADVGLPTGVRFGARIGESRFWAEFGAGVWWIVPFASTALRYDCRLYDGANDRFAARPSISATIIPIARDPIWGYGADVEVVWQHRFADRLFTDFGFRIGATALQGRRRDDFLVAPVLALVFAVQF